MRGIKSGLLWFGCLILLATASPASADDSDSNWGNFRGPNFNGTANTANPPVEWSQTKNVKWKAAILGRGSSSPIVWGDKVFLTTAVKIDGDNAAPAGNRRTRFVPADHKFMVMCFNRDTGEKIWEDVAIQRKPNSGHHPHHGYASSSPVTNGEHLYINFGSVGLFCYDLQGNQIWSRTDLGPMQTRGSFGEGSSVALSDDLLILPWDHEGQSRIEAIDKTNGKTVWKTVRDEPSAWATPVITTVNGKKQVIHAGDNYSRGYDLATGAEIWRSSGLSLRPVATPVVYANLGIFASSRRGSVLNAYFLDRHGDISSSEAWKIERQTPDCPSLLLSENRLFYLAANKAIISCANADDGSVFFGPRRLAGMAAGVYSSPVAGGGKVFITGRNGRTAVISDSETYQEIGTNVLGEAVDATLALVDDQIFIRGSKHLFCIQQSQK